MIRIFLGLTILLSVFLTQWLYGVGFILRLRLFAHDLGLTDGLLELVLAGTIVYGFLKLIRLRELLVHPTPGLGLMTSGVAVYVVTYVVSVKHFARVAFDFLGVDSVSLIKLSAAMDNFEKALFLVAGYLLIAGTFRMFATLPRRSEAGAGAQQGVPADRPRPAGSDGG